MIQMKNKVDDQSAGKELNISGPGHQEASNIEDHGLFQESVFEFLPMEIERLPSISSIRTQTSELQRKICNLHFGNRQNYYCPVQFVDDMSDTQSCVTTNSTQLQPWLPRIHEDRHCPRINDVHTLSGSTSDLTYSQMHNQAPMLPQKRAGVQKHVVDPLQKELRLMKNREAVRKSQLMKMKYIKCLENRVATLEYQNKALREQIRAFKYVQ